MCITIFGNITIEDVMSSITKIEAKISLKPMLPKWNRPWKTPVPVLHTTVVKRIVPWGYEGFSDIYIAWRGPNCVTEYRKLLACQTLISYLTSTAIPADVFAEKITGDIVENSETALYFEFHKVPMKYINSVYSKFHDRMLYISRGISHQTFRYLILQPNTFLGIEKIDLLLINNILNTKILHSMKKMETSALETISKLIANDFLYGSNPNDVRYYLQL